jgi:hypothetical protein
MHAALADDVERRLATGPRRESGEKGYRGGNEQGPRKSNRSAKGDGFAVSTGS